MVPVLKLVPMENKRKIVVEKGYTVNVHKLCLMLGTRMWNSTAAGLSQGRHG